MTVAETLAELTEIRRGGINPVHGVTDDSKLAALAASMEEHGWIGAPILVDGEQALTGSHRHAAANKTDTEIPCVEVRDLCQAYGIDWDALLDQQPLGIYMCYDAAEELADLLPADVVTYLGLDLH
jgi:hypothetical protein